MSLISLFCELVRSFVLSGSLPVSKALPGVVIIVSRVTFNERAFLGLAEATGENNF